MKKKGLLKNVLYVSIILLIAIVSTYYIYHKFQNDRNVDFSSESLDVVYHDSLGDRITLTKVVPVTDSVGLSSKAYNLSIKNNLTIDIPYVLRVVDDFDMIREDECGESLIGNENIRISVKVGKKMSEIYTLSELNDGVLLDEDIKALENLDIVIRVWVDKDTELTSGLDLHYHGKIQITEGLSQAVGD